MKPLQQLLLKEDAVIFVGSGVSRWAGLPSWEGLIEDLADCLTDQGGDAGLMRQEAKWGDLLQAASYGVDKLSIPQFAEFIRKSCKTGIVAPAPIHEIIMKLGPSCFVTTNYDDLLEQAFRRWHAPSREPTIVTNRQPLTQAEVVQATARSFIFKSHGDARDIESIVLTREHYRKLMPNGEYHATLNTLGHLLASRPVLFIGFGLRDPDFLHVRDLLANIYRGGVRDHYAIVADPVLDQINWWRNKYGVHLIGYETRLLADGSRDHNGLVELLAALMPILVSTAPALHKPVEIVAKNPIFNLNDPAFVLELARYGAGNIVKESGEPFDIRVSCKDDKSHSYRYAKGQRYWYWSAGRLLREGPDRLILTGAPGAGKTFAIRQVVNSAANALQDACLQGTLSKNTTVPVLVDLKIYDGDLAQQIHSRFPPRLDLHLLMAAMPVKLFLDGFNELPRTYRELGTFLADLEKLLLDHPGLQLVIGSRTGDGLERLSLQIFELSEITQKEVDRLIAEREYFIPDFLRQDIEAILRRPFYFRMVEQASITLDNVKTPADLYARFIGQVSRRFTAIFGEVVDLVEILEQQAYRAIELGTEAYSLEALNASIQAVAPLLSSKTIEEMLNWLVNAELLIPLGGGRVAFVHQSITEYLAARKLSARLIAAHNSVADLISLRRWDNVIFLTLSMLGADKARLLLEELIAIDLGFAMEGVRFVEEKRDDLLEIMLDVLLGSTGLELDGMVSFRFGRLPFGKKHEVLLRRLADEMPSLHAEAVSILARILGENYKPELIEMLFAEKFGWHAREALQALKPMLVPADIGPLIDRAIDWDTASLLEEEGDTRMRIDALGSIFSSMSAEVVSHEIFARMDVLDLSKRQILVELFSEYAADSKSSGATSTLIRFVREKLLKRIYSLYSNVNFEVSAYAVFVEEFDADILNSIIYYIRDGDKWACELLQSVCSKNSDVKGSVVHFGERVGGVLQHVLDYCATGRDEPLFNLLDAQVEAPIGVVVERGLFVLELNELNWSGRHDLFIGLLRRQESALASQLLGPKIPIDINGIDGLDLGEVRPWLGWVLELVSADRSVDRQAFWLSRQLAYLIARSVSPTNKRQLLDLLESEDAKVRWAIGHLILPNMEGITIEELGGNAVDSLIELLSMHDYSDYNSHIFNYIASEQFVREKLLPLVIRGDERIRANVASIVSAAGKRLGMRFILPPTEIENMT